MAKQAKVFTDYPEYAENVAKLAKLEKDLHAARAEEARAIDTAAKFEPVDSLDAEAHALIHGGAVVAVEVEAAEALKSATRRREAHERACETLRDELAAFRRAHMAELVSAWEPEVQAAQLRQVQSRIEAARADQAYYDVRGQMEAAGLSIGGRLGSMEGSSLGRLDDPYSQIRALILEAEAAGLKLGKIPELRK